MGSPLATVPLLNAVVFASFEQAKSYFVNYNRNHHRHHPEGITYAQAAMAGAWAGAVNSIIASPVELIKSRWWRDDGDGDDVNRLKRDMDGDGNGDGDGDGACWH